jgi:hypothetical protein
MNPRTALSLSLLFASACVATEPPAPTPELGSACDEHTDSDSELGAGNGFCYRGALGGSMIFPDHGYCTVDDGTGAVCATDEDCPDGGHCASIEGYRLCLPACGEGGACPEGQACFDRFGGLLLDKPVCLPGSDQAADGDACNGIEDCNASSQCFLDPEHPGGYCSAFSCTVGTDEGCHGGRCIAYDEGVVGGTVCVAPCVLDGDCRSAEGYVCHDPDGAGPSAGYCRSPHIGDACAEPEDCGADWTCRTGAGWPDGYCTVTSCATPGSSEGCGPGAVCAGVGGANQCVDRCPTIGAPDTCRGGYTCQDVGVASGNGGACLAP